MSGGEGGEGGEGQIVYPPWQLRGEGWILPLTGRSGWLREQGWLGQRAEDFAGGPGALMLVDYQQCPIGPYHELLCIPGRFRTPLGLRPAITRILVSSADSVRQGRLHWAIPKTLGSFRRCNEAGREIWEISEEGQPLARFELNAFGPALPVRSPWCPTPWRSLAQPDGDTWRLVAPTASARVRLGRCHRWCDGLRFPAPPGTTGLALQVRHLQMCFPPAEPVPMLTG